MLPPTMRPGGDATRRMMESDVTLLPHPDSPTTASVSPGATEKETPSTARTMPSRVKKCVFRSSISSRGALVSIASGSHVAGEARIERVAQTIAQHVHRQHGEGQEDAGEEDQVGGDLEEGAALGHDVA